MNALGRYAIASLLIVTVAVLALWPFVGSEGHRSLILAGGVAWPVQVLAFAGLSRALGDPNRFMKWWGAGIAVRAGVVILLGVSLGRFEGFEPAVLLLSVAGFFFALSLLEPAFFDKTANTAQHAQ